MISAIVILAALCLALILLNPVTLVLLLRPALLCVDGGSRKPTHVIAALVGWVVDVLGMLTWWRLIAGSHQPGEKTISNTLERLANVQNQQHPQFKLMVEIGRAINRISPSEDHIKSVLKDEGEP